MSKLQRSAACAEIVSAAVVTVSVVIAVLAYLNESDNQRREFTMEVAMQFFSGDLQSQKDDLFYTIRSIQQSVSPVRLGASDLRTYIEKSEDFQDFSNKPLNESLLAVGSFFNSAQRCVQAKLCDDALMRQLISEDATSINCIFGAYLEDLSLRSNVRSISLGLRYFSESKCV